MCLVYNSIIICFTDLFISYIFIQNAYADKKVVKKLCLMGQIVIESHSFLEHWQNRLNPRELTMVPLKPYNLINNVKNNVVFLTLTNRQTSKVYMD